jgi:hypothetical protein
MRRGPIPGVNRARKTASLGYRGSETGLSAQAGRTLDMAPNTLPEVFADLGLLPLMGVSAMDPFDRGGDAEGAEEAKEA